MGSSIEKFIKYYDLEQISEDYTDESDSLESFSEDDISFRENN